MARAQPVLTNFTAGELAPELNGRTDLSFYFNGCQTLENFVPFTQGPATFRPGLRFKAETALSASASRLIGFEFSDIQAYMFEAGDRYIRFYKDRGRLEIATTDAVVTNGTFTGGITGWTNRSTGTGSIAHDATNHRLSLAGGSSGVGWAEQSISHTKTGQEHVVRFQVFGVAGDAVQLRIGTTSTGSEIIADRSCAVGYHCVAFTPGASPFFLQFRNTANKTLQVDDVALISGAPLEIGSPYLASADLFKLRDEQSADVLYLNDARYREMKLTRSGHTTWSLTETNFLDGPWLDLNLDAGKTLTPSATTGLGITISATGHSPFSANDVGRLVRLTHGATTGYAIITAFGSATSVSADVRAAFGATTATASWRLGAWSNGEGWPAAATFHDQRFWRGGPTNRPNRVDGSKVGDFDNYAIGTSADDDPVAVSIVSRKVPSIRWLAGEEQLFVGTLNAEYLLRSDRLDGPITPTNISAPVQTRHGCAALRPVATASGLVFVQRQGKKLRELSFAFERDKFVATDLSRRARHIAQAAIVDVAYQEEPYPIVWAVRADGALIGCAYEREEQALAWHRHPIGGGGLAESVAVISGVGYDEVWCIVRRTVNGATKRYVELMDPFAEATTPPEDSFHLDSGLSLDNTIATTLTPGADATTVGATGVPFTAGGATFSAGDVGRFIKYRYETGATGFRGEPIWKTAVAEITGFTSALVVSAAIRRAFPSLATIAASAWRLTVTQISGLDHLEGETVAIVGDGAEQASRTVVGGAITLAEPAATVHAGLKYTGRLRSMPLEGGTSEGGALGKLGRVSRVVVRFLRTGGAKVGRDEALLEPVILRTASDDMDTAVPLFSGDKAVPFPGSWERDADVLIVQDSPLPCTVVALSPRFTKSEG
jgi:hypothetical protein